MGLILMLGIGLDFFGISWLVITIILIGSAIKKKKISLYIISVLALLVTVVALGSGIYFTLGPLQYAGMI
ncbi:MAG: hypothetical protein KBT48_12395 [Firmicutes bacterium]|nr:hypothetical protein [Bacillota bacterium]